MSQPKYEKSTHWRHLFKKPKAPPREGLAAAFSKVRVCDPFSDPLVSTYMRGPRKLSLNDAMKLAALTRRKRRNRPPPPSRVGLKPEES